MVQNVGTIEYEVDARTGSILEAERQVDRSTKAMEQDFNRADQSVNRLNTTVKQTPAAVRQANQSLNRVRTIAGQAGFQLQDLAVQIQGGTNAMVAFGQQGSQLAGAFGPGGAVFGAIIAIGAAIFTTLNPSIEESTKSLAELNEEALQFLGRAQQIEAIAGQALLSDLEQQAVLLSGELQTVNTQIDSFARRLGDAAEEEPEFRELIRTSERLNKELAGVTQNADDVRQRIQGLTDGTIENEKAVSTLVSALQSEAEVLGLTRRETALLVATKRGATEADIASINASFDLIDSYNQQAAALKNLRATQSAGIEGPVQGQAGRDASTRAGLLQESDPAAAIREQEFARIEALREGRDNFLITEQEFNAARLAEEERTARLLEQVRSKSNQSTFDNLEAANSTVSSLQQAGIIDARRAAGIQAAISLATNIAKASEVGFPANIPLIAGAVAQGAQIKRIISGADGRQLGGPVSAGTPYRVGEAGPEILQQNGMNYLIPGQDGNVVSNRDAFGQTGDISVNINNINQSSSATSNVTARRGSNGVTIDVLVRDIDSGNGPLSAAFSRSTNLTRRTS